MPETGGESMIAIIGMSCRLPMAPDPGAFWQLLSSGRDAITEVPAGRPATGRRGGYLDRVDGFDADFFGISPREAAVMDPQQRLMLELSWEAVEDARIAPDSLRGSRTAVVVGVMADDYSILQHSRGELPVTPYTLTGLNRGIIANRVAHTLALRGPSLTVDTGQSSSLVGVHLACASLRRGECAQAIAGGVHLNLAPQSTTGAAEFGALSPEDRCFTFDARANGYVRGEGGAAVVLKPVDRALADGDRIYCVIAGGAVNSGAADALTVPSPAAQEDVLRLAYRQAGVPPSRVQYVELHGTGTAVGDPVEAAALGSVLGAGRTSRDALLVGSVKTNIGHLEGAAGIAGLVKAALSISHRQIPPSLNFESPHPDIALDDLGLRVARDADPWPDEGRQLIAGVSAFGMGGANCHLVLAEQSPRPTDADRPDGPAVLPWIVSARSGPALQAQAERLADYVAGAPALDVTDIGLSLTATRTGFEHRAAVVARDRAGFDAGLRAVAAGSKGAEVVPGSPGTRVLRGEATGGRLAVLFPGQGTQRPGMGRSLAGAFPAFDEAFAAVCAEADGHLDRPLREIIWSESADVLNQTQYTQISMFAMEVALYRLWESWGVRADLLAGHSVGEIAAAHLAGVLDLADAVTFVAARGVLMQGLPAGGAMISLQATEEEVLPLLEGEEDRLSIAAVNGPAAVVIAGEQAAADRVAGHFTDQGRKARRLKVSHAFHSPLMDPILPQLHAVAEGLTFRPPGDLAVASCVTGQLATARELQSPGYWVRHARQAVRFGDCVSLLHADGARIFLEAGPGHGLGVLARGNISGSDSAFVSLGAAGEEELIGALARLHVHGAQVDWRAFFGAGARPVDLPTYPFQPARLWLDAAARGDAGPHDTGPRDTAPRDTGPRDTAPRDTGPQDAQEPAAAAGSLAALAGADREQAVTELVAGHAAATLGHDSGAAIDLRRTFNDLGFDSRMAVELRERLAEATELELPAELLFNYPTGAQLVEHLCAALAEQPGAAAAEQPGAAAAEPGGPAGAGSVAAAALRGSGRGPAGGPADEPIAIVAMGCRYPAEVRTPEDLWQLVRDGADGISEFPANRGWDLGRLHEQQDEQEERSRSATRYGGFLHDADLFDPGFFGINPREAAAMDPQQRVLLETVWAAFEGYGLDPAELRGEPVGVFMGAMEQDYGPRMHEGGSNGGYLLTGVSTSVVSGRIAYVFGLEGPALTVNTACSSSLVSTHLAVQSLRHGECRLALAGGVAVMASPGMFVDFSSQGGLAPDGRCKAFAAGADGTAWAEGAGVLVLERLSDARRRGHRVLAQILGTATNQDGTSNGLSAPSGRAQERVIRQALSAAGLDGSQVDVVEAHGTGTPLGDPIEAHALQATYGRGRPADQPLWLGSLKSNIGHTQAAAGVGGVIKMVQAIRAGWLPATLHASEPTPEVDWASGGVALLTEGQPWPSVGRARRAAVSSFGISGTNAHVIIEQAPAPVADKPDPACANDGPDATDASWNDGNDGNDGGGTAVPWVLSARSRTSLLGYGRRLLQFAADHPDVAPADIGFSLAGRPGHPCRAVVVGAEHGDFEAGLAALTQGEPAPGLVEGSVVRGKTVFVFPGQGSQWTGMAAELMRSSPAFRAEMEACDAALAPHVSWSLLDAVLDSATSPPMDRVDVIQPVLFAIMVSLARVWRSLGIEPDAVVGHSQGEIAAACVAGALSLEDGAKVVALRSKALGSVAGTGGMASVLAPADQVRERLSRWDGALSIAAVNGPASTVVAGETGPLAELIAGCEADGIDARQIDVDYASHTRAMEVLESDLLGLLADVTPRQADIPLYSTLTGQRLDTTGMDAGYWYANISSTVQFEQAVGALLDDGHAIFVEASAHPVLTAGVQDTAQAAGSDVVYTGTLRRGQGGLAQLVKSLAVVHAAGGPVDWGRLWPGARPVDLPAYEFDRQRYWIDQPASGFGAAGPAGVAGRAAAGHPMLGTEVDLPHQDGLMLTGRLSVATHPWLADHAVAGTVLVPGTGLLEMARLAAERAGCGGIEELTLEQPLSIPEDGGVRVQLAVDAPDEAGRRAMSVHARPEDPAGPWTRHASGTLARDGQRPHPAAQGAPWPPPEAEPISLDGLYERLAGRGYSYGPAFRGLRAAWRRDGDLFAEVALPAEVEADAASYGLHPALLDAALHLLVDAGDGPPLLPFSWSDATLDAAGTSALRVRLSPAGPDQWSLSAADSAGEPAGSVGTLLLRPMPAAPPEGEPLLRADWQDLGVEPGAAPGDWAVVGPDDLGLDGRQYPDLASLGDAVPGLVVAAIAADDAGLPGAAHAAAARALDLVQTWVSDERFAASKLAIVTRDAVAAVPGDRVDGVALAGAWGLVRSAQSEHPDCFVLLDVGSGDAQPDAVLAALATGAAQVAVRRGRVYRPRLAPARRGGGLTPPAGHAAWCLEVSGTPAVESLALEPCPEAAGALADGQVRIGVRAAGLNFRDVTIALGLLPDEKHLGIEGAGVVLEVAGDVTHLQPGDRVLGMFRRAFGPVAIADSAMVAPLPAGWSFAAGAAVPIAFLTAYQALTEIAGLRRGESVLVHSAAGGVGMAAVQLARHLGARVFGTASPGKRAAAGLAADHFATSRSPLFEERFRDAVGDRGMDVVLNCLAGELTDASLRLLSDGGRFVEIGKTDLRDPAAVAAAHPKVTYQAYNLLDVAPERIGEMLAELLDLFERGVLKLPPVTSWDVRRAPEAFRYMSQARHTGKIVLTIPRSLDPDGAVLITGGTGTLGGLLARHLASRHGVRRLILASRHGPGADGVASLEADLARLGAEVTVASCDASSKEALESALAGQRLTAVIHAAGFLDDGIVTALTPERVSGVLRPKADGAWHLHELTRDQDLAAFVMFSSASGVLGEPGQANYAAANVVLDSLAQYRQARGLPGTALAWGVWQERSGMTGHLREDDFTRMKRTGMAPLSSAEALDMFDAALALDEALLVPMRTEAVEADAVSSVPDILRDVIKAARRPAASARAAAPQAVGPHAVGPHGAGPHAAGQADAASREPAPAAARGDAGEVSLARRLSGAADEEQERVLLELVCAHAATALGFPGPESVPPDRPFKELGFDSLTGVELRNRLGKVTGLRLAAALITDNPTPIALTQYLRTRLGADPDAVSSPPAVTQPT